MRAAFVVGLAALVLVLQPTRSADHPWQASLVSTYVWRIDDPAFGGFSGIDLTADGADFVAVSDRGAMVQGKLHRDMAGAVVAVDAGPILPLLDQHGKLLGDYALDAEGLALQSDGRIFVSFEGQHRVASYAAVGAASDPLPRPQAFRTMQWNSSLEALAIDAAGTIYTMPERSGALDRPFPIYRFRNGTWDQPFSMPRSGEWLPTGADFGPDGRLYVLERNFQGIWGFLSRIERFTVTEKGLTDAVVLLETPAGTHDNLESIAVWSDASGAIRLTMISDDNFRYLQRTEIVDYRVTE